MISAAGIVTYYPDFARLTENISRLEKQADIIYVVDNTPPNENILEDYINNNHFKKKINFISNSFNVGLSKALNQLCQRARNDGLEWLLLLDQDSLISNNFFENLSNKIHSPNVGLLCPLIIEDNPEINTCIESNIDSNEINIIEVNAAITSGSYVNLSIHEMLGGFYEPYFIDLIDFDYSRLLVHSGFKIHCISRNYILHQYGTSEPTILSKFYYKMYNKNLPFFYRRNYSTIRVYYQFRNNVIFYRRWINSGGSKLKSTFIFIKVLFLNLIRQVILERRPLLNMYFIIKGLIIGFLVSVEKVE